MKKLFAIALILCVVACAMAGCGTKEGTPSDTPAGITAGMHTGNATPETPKGTPDEGADYSKVKIGVLLNTTGEDGGPGQALYDSVQKVKAKRGLDDGQIVWAEDIYDGTEDVDATIEEMVEDGCNLIVGHSAGYADQLATAAEKHPKVYFAGLECPVDAENFAMYSARDHEPLFLCGYIAARMSDDGTLGFVGSIPSAFGIRAVDAFALGAKYANKNAKVSVVWVNDLNDPEAEREAAKALIDLGATSLGSMGAGDAVMKVCAKYNVFSTGMYIDMQTYAPSSVLTSQMGDWSFALDELAGRVARGAWSSDPVSYGLSAGAAGLAALNTKIVPSDIAAAYEAVKAKVILGDIQVFAGPLYDDGGNLIVREGEALPEEDLLYIDFLVDNVVDTTQEPE